METPQIRGLDEISTEILMPGRETESLLSEITAGRREDPHFPFVLTAPSK